MMVLPPREKLFFLSQCGVFATVIFLGWFFRPKKEESQFQSRESDRKSKPSPNQALAQAKIKSQPLLPGIRLDLPPHEILGVSLTSTPKEIDRAYKKLMKQYHPDRVARADSPQWHEAQKIAEALNSARAALLKNLR